jgi:hypothetical protein
VDPLTVLAVTIPIMVMGIAITKILTNQRVKSQFVAQEIKKDYGEILKSRDQLIEALKQDVLKYKNKASNMETGPRIEGELGELTNFLPDIVKEFEPYAPKWLKPILGNQDAQAWIVEYVSKHPEKLEEWFARFIKSKGTPNSQTQGPAQTEML